MTHRIRTPADLQQLMRAGFPPSDEQFAAITAPLEPAVVVAGAGSGKTTVMAARVVYLVATGQVRPDQVLGLTFTTKAAGELATRVRGALRDAGLLRPVGPEPVGTDGHDEAEEPMEPTVATYNSYASALLAEHGLRIGHEPDTRVIADATRYQLAARAVARYTGDVQLLSDHPETVINYVLALEGAMSEHLVDPDTLRSFQRRERTAFAAELEVTRARKKLADVICAIDRREELLGLVEAYRRLKRDLGLMDFSDQIALGARLAVERREVGEIERDKFRVVLLDEYQDTSVAQATMLSRLFSGPDPEHGRGHPVTAVGDPNQAIYGWRGASVSNILNVGADFPTRSGSADVPSYPLAVNRRSDRRILEVANRLAQPLYAAFPQVQPLRSPEEPADGQVRTVVHETYLDELAWLPEQVRKAYAGLADASWAGIGVLVRDNAHAADVFDALTRAEIPVEIVGLQGLLRLPEVAEVVATLTLLHDLTANAALLTLLTGPRWSIGPRDLALLGRRAAHLSGGAGRGGSAARDVAEELTAAVAGADPTEVASLCDALDDPGTGDRWEYSPEARERFGLLSGELRRLRAHTGEPLLDLVRRIVDTTGLDVELASSVSPAAQARRENLDLFVKAVAEFQAVDGDVSLPALLSYLQAEDELGNGLDVATPTEADSVKLLTVHRAKGLEWDVVFLVGVVDGKFPTTRGRTRWTSGPAVLPTPLRGDAGDLPSLAGHTSADLDALGREWKRHEAQEELRLGYVAFTRARHELVVSSYLWGPTQQKPLGPSPYQHVVREALQEWGGDAEQWRDLPAPDTVNPLRRGGDPVRWPAPLRTPEVERRLAAAALVRDAIARLEEGAPGTPDEGLDVVEAVRVAEWDEELDRLLEEARRDRAEVLEVPLPSSLSATAVARLRDDPERFAADLARPMPRKPSPSARFGTRFHAWVEARFGQQQLLDPDELPGRADAGIEDEDDLAELVARFEAGAFADRVPVAVEPPFALVLGGQVVRGRIDAVYDDRGPGERGAPPRYLVVDWKTNKERTADALQLALYRVAWAELAGVPVERVRAAFYYVRSGDLVEPEGLPGRPALEELLSPPAG